MVEREKENVVRKIIVSAVAVIVATVMLSAAPPVKKKAAPAKRATVAAKKTAVAVKKESPSPFKTQQQKLSYALGMDIAKRLKSIDVKVDVQLFNKAVQDVLSGAKPMLTEKEADAARRSYFMKLGQARKAKEQAEAKKNLKAGQAFLARNKTQPGVVPLPDGLQYLVIKKGTGASPKLDDEVTVNYSGTLVDGTEFDSSYVRGKPAVFPVKRIIKGFREGLLHMKAGGKYRLFIPANLAYGNRRAGKLIGPGSTLIFDVDLLSVKKAPLTKPGIKLKGKRITTKTK